SPKVSPPSSARRWRPSGPTPRSTAPASRPWATISGTTTPAPAASWVGAAARSRTACATPSTGCGPTPSRSAAADPHFVALGPHATGALGMQPRRRILGVSLENQSMLGTIRRLDVMGVRRPGRSRHEPSLEVEHRHLPSLHLDLLAPAGRQLR